MSEQMYDHIVKDLFSDDGPEVVSVLLEGAQVVEELGAEVIRPPMRADRVFSVLYRDKPHVYHLEFQAGPDEELPYRVLLYNAGLLRRYHLPVISHVLYLFQTTLPIDCEKWQ